MAALRDASGPGSARDSGIMAGQRVGLDDDRRSPSCHRPRPDRRTALSGCAPRSRTRRSWRGHQRGVPSDAAHGRGRGGRRTGHWPHRANFRSCSSPGRTPDVEALAADVVLAPGSPRRPRGLPARHPRRRGRHGPRGRLRSHGHHGADRRTNTDTAAHRDRLAARRIGGTAWRGRLLRHHGPARTGAVRRGPLARRRDRRGTGNRTPRKAARCTRAKGGVVRHPVRTRTGAAGAARADPAETTAAAPELALPHAGAPWRPCSRRAASTWPGPHRGLRRGHEKMEHPITATLPVRHGSWWAWGTA
ncbi:hypothetical protein QJS66_13570 [Kocuria rhizophila]|nr:hypothetical protein QJS66_13570 [Kocuria rhizophila]